MKMKKKKAALALALPDVSSLLDIIAKVEAAIPSVVQIIALVKALLSGNLPKGKLNPNILKWIQLIVQLLGQALPA